jgi:hypothetical protein
MAPEGARHCLQWLRMVTQSASEKADKKCFISRASTCEVWGRQYNQQYNRQQSRQYNSGGLQLLRMVTHLILQVLLQLADIVYQLLYLQLADRVSDAQCLLVYC